MDTQTHTHASTNGWWTPLWGSTSAGGSGVSAYTQTFWLMSNLAAKVMCVEVRVSERSVAVHSWPASECDRARSTRGSE